MLHDGMRSCKYWRRSGGQWPRCRCLTVRWGTGFL